MKKMKQPMTALAICALSFAATFVAAIHDPQGGDGWPACSLTGNPCGNQSPAGNCRICCGTQCTADADISRCVNCCNNPAGC